jgi:hypothetical protein
MHTAYRVIALNHWTLERLTSTLLPIDGESGKRTSPGTNNMENHLATKLAPGWRNVKADSAAFGLICSIAKSDTNNAIHPPSMAGN